MNKHNILRELAKDKDKSQNQILREFRGKGYKIGNEKGHEIIREARKEKLTRIKERDERIKERDEHIKERDERIKERDEHIKELLKDDYTFRELGQIIRGKGFKIGNEALLKQYREIRLYNKIASLKKSVEAGRMQKTTAEHIEAKMRDYFRKGQINNLNNLYGRLYDDENNPTFMDS